MPNQAKNKYILSLLDKKHFEQETNHPLPPRKRTIIMIAKTWTVVALLALLETTSAFNTNRPTASKVKRGLFGNKRGQAYNDASLANKLQGKCSDCTWAYNWGQTPNGLDSSISFVPMLHDANGVSTWNDNANAAINAGSKAVMSFNEPDIPSQSNLSPNDAADLHIKYMNPFRGKAKIGAPAVSNSGDPNQGLGWLSQWQVACGSKGGCHYDFCNIHWYSGVEYETTLFDQIEAAHKICGTKPIWITEFAPTDGSADQLNSFMEYALPKLDDLDYVEAYSYFMTSVGVLFSDSNNLSEFGSTYATLSA